MNAYRELKEIVRDTDLEPELIVHALMATVYCTCCEECGEMLRSEAFLKAFRSMASEMMKCRQIYRNEFAHCLADSHFAQYQEQNT